MDAPALANSIAHLNASSTFQPLQPLHDTDVTGYLRHAHEQTLISTIEEGRRETQEEFYRVLEERNRRDWEIRKRRVFEELGGRVTSDGKANGDLRKSVRVAASLGVSFILTINIHGCIDEESQQSTSLPLSNNLQMQSKMLAYDRAVTELNKSRLRGTSYPIVHTLHKIAGEVTTDVSSYHKLSA